MPAMLIKRVSSPRIGYRRKKKGEGGRRKRRKGRNRKKRWVARGEVEKGARRKRDK